MERNIYVLIAKYFEGISSEAETQVVEAWYSQSDANKETFWDLKRAWIASDKLHNEKIRRSKDSIWSKISKKTIESIEPFNFQKTSKRQFYIYASVAASIAILLTLLTQYISGFDLHHREVQYMSVYMPKGERGQILLPDGSKVWVNGNSKVSYDSNYNNSNRKVILEGQAYFEVVPSKNRFTVEVSGIDVVVYGTSFDIMAYQEDSEVSIMLKEGSVGIYKEDNELARLSPNQKAIVDKNTYAIAKIEVEPRNYLAWTFDELIFEFTATSEMYKLMENWYGVDITVSKLPKEEPKYRYKIKSESLIEVLELINKITPINYQIEGKEVTIKYK